MGKAKRLKLLRRAAKNMTVGAKDVSYDLGRGNPLKQSPVILRQGCTKATYKQLKKDNPEIVFEDENGSEEESQQEKSS